jgi:hypothetical protein
MNKETCSDYYLERYILGELPGEDAQKIRQQASTNPKVLAALEDIESSNKSILLRYPPAAVKEKLLGRLAEIPGAEKERGRLTRITPLQRLLFVSSAFAAALLLFVLVRPSLKRGGIPEELRGGEEYSQAKGTEVPDLSKTQLLVYRKNKERVEMLTDGSLSKTGDLLQLAYVAARAPYGVILSIDGRGKVSLHYPAEQGEATDLTQNKRVLLPNAIELDDAPLFERFFFFTSASPIDLAGVLEKAKTLAADPERAREGKLELPKGIDQNSITILKGEGS